MTGCTHNRQVTAQAYHRGHREHREKITGVWQMLKKVEENPQKPGF
jgi:hypothetical protein